MGLTFIRLAVISALAVATYSCKPKSQSQLRSLDNFSGVSSRSNTCLADPSKQYEAAQHPMTAVIRLIGPMASGLDTPLKAKLQHAIVNIPEPVQRIFALSAGKVVVADNSKELCAAANVVNTSTKNDESKDSCLVYIAPSPANKQVLHLVLPPDMGRIQHNIMRLVGVFVADLLPMVEDRRKDQIAEFRSAAAMAFLNDVLTSKALDANKILSHLGSDGFVRAVRGAAGPDKRVSLERFAKSIAQADTKTSAELKSFSRSVFVEGFDSWFCNTWSPAADQDLQRIARGDLAPINQIYNTRAIMKALFPETHALFAGKMDTLIAGAASVAKTPRAVRPVTAGSSKPSGFNLGAGDDPNGPVMWDANGDGSYGPLEQTASVVGTFGRSLFWDNTTKPVANAYGRYSDRVNEAWARGDGVIGGYASGASQQYKEDIAKPIGDRAESVFNQQVTGGADVNTAFRNTMAVELLRPTGATQFTESAILGQRFDGSQYRDGFEQASEFSFGVAGLASTATLPLSLMPKGAVPTGPGVTPTAAQMVDMESALLKIGVDPKRAASYSGAFEGGSKVVEIPSGTSLYRYGEGPGSWLSRTPVRDPVNSLALPVSSEHTATQLNRFVTTKPTIVVEGSVSPQPGWATPGNPKLGGVGQIYMKYSDATGGALRAVPLKTPLEQAVIPAAGTTSTTGAAGGKK